MISYTFVSHSGSGSHDFFFSVLFLGCVLFVCGSLVVLCWLHVLTR